MQQDAFVIRPMNSQDLPWFLQAVHSVDLGFTSLPDSQEFITKRLKIVDQSFAEQIPPRERIYLFAREDIVSGKILGIAGIQACVGEKSIFYNYEISTISQEHQELNIHVNHKVLNLSNDFQDASEMISFWIHKDYRGMKIGKYLSKARMLFMAQFPALFGETVIAEIRGITNEHGVSPFWEAVDRNFFQMDFKRADYLTMTTDKHYIADLMPRMPIYIDILPQEARDVIGHEHPDATPARKLLEREGFEFNNYIDIFDAGPLLTVKRKNITTVIQHKVATISACLDHISQGIDVIAGTSAIKMRITAAKINVLANDNIEIEKGVAQILALKPGDLLCYCPI